MLLGRTGKSEGARQPRKPQISPTKLRTFLECPLKYKIIYVLKTGRFFYTPNIGDSFGGSLHRALQDFHAAGGHDTQTSEQLIERLENTWVAAGYASKEDEKDQLQSGMQMLEQYYTDSRRDAATLFTERQLKHDMGNFVLIGRVDRVDEWPEGILEIVDYKSGRRSVTEQEVANDLAMSIYQLLIKKNYPEKRALATIHCLKTGKMASAELSDNELTELEEMIRQVAPDMLSISVDSDIQPERKPICDHCDFFKLCARSASIEGIDWPAKKDSERS